MKARRILLGCVMLVPPLVYAQTQQAQQNQQPSQSQQPPKTQQVTNCRTLDSAGGFIASDEVLVDGLVCKLTKPKKVVFVPEVPQGTSGNSTSTPGAKTIETSASDQSVVQQTPQSGSVADIARSYGKTSKILAAPTGKTEAPVVRPGASMAEIARAYKGQPPATASMASSPIKAETVSDAGPTQNLSVADAARAYGKVSQVLVSPKNANSESGQVSPPVVEPGASVAEIARAYKRSTEPQLITSKDSAARRLLTKPERGASAETAAPVETPSAAASTMVARESALPEKEIPRSVSSTPEAKVEQPTVARTVVPSEPSLPNRETPATERAAVANVPTPIEQPGVRSIPTAVPEPASQPAAKAELRAEPTNPEPVAAKSVPQTVAEVAPEPVPVVEAPPKPVLRTEFAKPESKAAKRVTASAPSIGVAGQNASSGLTSAAVNPAIEGPEPPPAEQVKPAENSVAETAAGRAAGKNETVPEVVLSSAPAEPAKEAQVEANRSVAVELGASAPPEAARTEATPAANAEAPAPAGKQAEVAAEPAPAPAPKVPGEVKSSGFDAASTATVEAKPEAAAEPTPSAAMGAAQAAAPATQMAPSTGTFAQPDATTGAPEKVVVQGAMPATIDDSADARPEVQTGSFGTPEIPVVEAKPEKPIDPFEQGQSLDDLSGEAPHPGCSKIVSLGSLEKDRLMLTLPTWALQWAVKNQKKFPGICFADAPVQGLRSFLIVFFTTPMPAGGVTAASAPGALDSVLQKPSGGTFSTTFGSTWHYTEDNAATTTVTTALEDSVPKNWGTDTQYAIAYSEQGTAVSQHYPGPLKKKELELLNAKAGGKHDPSGIEARRLGDLLTAILQDIASH